VYHFTNYYIKIMYKVNKSHTLVLIVDFNTKLNSNTKGNIGPFNEMIYINNEVKHRYFVSYNNMNSPIQHNNTHTYTSSAKCSIIDYTHIICNQKII
jgi:hypothetical protein